MPYFYGAQEMIRIFDHRESAREKRARTYLRHFVKDLSDIFAFAIGRFERDHLEHRHSERPDIDTGAVLFSIKLGCHEFGRSCVRRKMTMAQVNIIIT